MAVAATYLTWDGDPPNSVPPRRPSTDDLGGDNKLDNLVRPPDHETMPTADGWNQKVDQVAAIAKVVAACKLFVHFTAGSPAITRVAAPGSAIAPATFTVTDVATGVVQIVWPAGTFPTAAVACEGPWIYSATAPAGARWGQLEDITNGIKVRLYEGTTPADLDFELTIN